MTPTHTGQTITLVSGVNRRTSDSTSAGKYYSLVSHTRNMKQKYYQHSSPDISEGNVIENQNTQTSDEKNWISETEMSPVESGESCTFLQNESGAVVRTVQSKLCELLSPADFDVVDNSGSSDSTGAFLKLFSALQE
jgi:hypothetical protein